ncbi:PAQR family membrane homeostasis protein TrhA [Pseudozobellia thermophila]|uniref:Hemolysin III n=1 Tax=Pseudozobellia thermophila TaxID=192903 RepID=A0A1M6J6S0_9FLAO|nr:hemolysin III family protein [Pseudozobellia thermophila]SHJ42360.1 hemolysin III [Pseudozobellia thermophila]
MGKQDIKYKEERLNTVSHAIGAFLAVPGTLLLLCRNSGKSEWATPSILVYGLSLIAMFLVSSLYHYTQKVNFKRKLRILDHINIYFLIAGTYTPICLITLVKANGWTIFFAVWAIALAGTVFKLYYTGRFEFISLLLYVGMGWLIVLDFNNFVEYTSVLGVRLLFLGGVFYTFGILFYAFEKIPYHHFIWHLFVLAGAISHWLVMFISVV